MIQFNYEGENYPWQWTMRALIYVSDQMGIDDVGVVSALIDEALLGEGATTARLRVIEHMACGGFYAADPVKFEKLGVGGVDAILSDDAAFPTMVAEIMRKSTDFIEKQNTTRTTEKKKQRTTLLGKLFAR